MVVKVIVKVVVGCMTGELTIVVGVVVVEKTLVVMTEVVGVQVVVMITVVVFVLGTGIMAAVIVTLLWVIMAEGFAWRDCRGGGEGESFRGGGRAVLAVMVGVVRVIRKGRDTWRWSYSLPGRTE